jgi:hypothetical protein
VNTHLVFGLRSFLFGLTEIVKQSKTLQTTAAIERRVP